MIFVNGNEAAEFIGKNVLEMLEKREFKLARIAVELNGEILPKAKYGETKLADGDLVEVVTFVAGG